MTILDAGMFVAFLVVTSWAVVGAWIWIRHGYDGVEFIQSRRFSLDLLEFKIERESKKDLKAKDAAGGSGSNTLEGQREELRGILWGKK